MAFLGSTFQVQKNKLLLFETEELADTCIPGMWSRDHDVGQRPKIAVLTSVSVSKCFVQNCTSIRPTYRSISWASSTPFANLVNFVLLNLFQFSSLQFIFVDISVRLLYFPSSTAFCHFLEIRMPYDFAVVALQSFSPNE